MSLQYNLLSAQRQLFNCPDQNVDVDFCIYQGGFGSGKTFSGTLLGLKLIEKYPYVDGLVVAKTYPLLRDTTIETYFDFLEAWGLEDGVDFEWNENRKRLSFPKTRNRIFFRSVDKPWKLKSLNVGWAQLEECSELEEADIDMVISRVRQGTMKRKRIFGTTNPQMNKGWIHDQTVKRAGIREMDVEGEKVRLNYRRIIAPTTENIANVGAAYIGNMKSKFDLENYRINVLGQDGDYNRGLVCHSYSEANLDESIVYNSKLRIYLTCDFNVDPMCWEIAHRTILPGGKAQYEFFDELCIENTNIIETAKEFIRRYGKHLEGVTVTGDATGRNRSDSSANPNDSKYRILMNTLSDGGMTNLTLDVLTANPHEDIRVETWNGLLCNAEDVKRIKIHPTKCRWLVWNLENLKYIQGTSIIQEPSPQKIEKDTSHTLKFTKHPFDAASYLTYRFDPIKKDMKHQNKPFVKTVQFNNG
jgi:PBSX family phage terminase large subunit